MFGSKATGYLIVGAWGWTGIRCVGIYAFDVIVSHATSIFHVGAGRDRTDTHTNTTPLAI